MIRYVHHNTYSHTPAAVGLPVVPNSCGGGGGGGASRGAAEGGAAAL